MSKPVVPKRTELAVLPDTISSLDSTIMDIENKVNFSLSLDPGYKKSDDFNGDNSELFQVLRNSANDKRKEAIKLMEEKSQSAETRGKIQKLQEEAKGLDQRASALALGPKGRFRLSQDELIAFLTRVNETIEGAQPSGPFALEIRKAANLIVQEYSDGSSRILLRTIARMRRDFADRNGKQPDPEALSKLEKSLIIPPTELSENDRKILERVGLTNVIIRMEMFGGQRLSLEEAIGFLTYVNSRCSNTAPPSNLLEYGKAAEALATKKYGMRTMEQLNAAIMELKANLAFRSYFGPGAVDNIPLRFSELEKRVPGLKPVVLNPR